MTKIAVDVLIPVLIADGGGLYGRQLIAGTSDEIPAALFADLKAAGYVAEAGKKKGGTALKTDGPTVAEYVAAGYLASNYPPAGYASRSTAEEIAAAVEAEKAGGGAGDDDAAKKKAEQDRIDTENAMKAELTAMTVAQLRDLAKAEDVALASDDNRKDEIVAKIVAARLAKG